MNAGFRYSSIVANLVLVLICIGCDGVGTTVSDVPCVQASDWGFSCPLIRAAADGSDVLLFTGHTSDQARADLEDGMNDFQPHGTVYRLVPRVGSFELVNDSAWDDADSEVIICCGGGPSSPLRIAGFFSPRLNFDGASVAVAGGNALRVVTSPTRAVTAVLSSAGFSAGAPFVNSGFGTGQHFHQLFSEIDGSPLGDPIRVGVGDAVVEACWTAQERYVIYWQTTSGDESTRSHTVCAVPIPEDLPPLEGE